jgi:O-antigen ligase
MIAKYTNILPLPSDGRVLLFITFFIIGAASILTAFSTPQIGLGLILILLFILLILAIKINTLQLLLLTTILPALSQSKLNQLGNIALAIEIGLFLFWIVALIILDKSRFDHRPSLDILIWINLFFALNTLISSIYNSALNAVAFLEIFRFVLYAGLIAISYHYLNSIDSINKIKWTALAGSAIYAALGYKMFLGAGALTVQMYGAAFLHGATIGLANSNTIATVIANPMPFLLAYCMFGNNKRLKLLNWIIFFYLFFIWLVWNSRASYIYLFFAFITLILFHKNRQKYLTYSLVGLLLIFLLSLSNIIPHLSDFLRLEMGTSHREVIWNAGLRMFTESPFFGKGPSYFDQYKFYYMDAGIGRSVVGTFTGISPHNVLIMKATDMGILAVIAQLIYWFVPIIFFVKNANRLKDSEHYYLYLASGATWTGMIFRSQFDTGASVFSMILLSVIFKMPQLIVNAAKTK